MSGLSHPNDEMNQAENLPFAQGKEEPSFLHPIDEAEDFYDPFSDLSLFLSKKIKTEIESAGSLNKWSGKIEANLLSKILPEFKQKFPKYRLGASALRKVWEKVAYYYEKIQGQKGALEEDGRLNLKYMIRENLKKCSAPTHIPPYTLAQQIAVKLAECIAAIEGKKPEQERLTKSIWAIQKHLFKDLSPLQAKSPYEEFDKLDKLIIKTQLEITTKENILDPETLKRSVLNDIDAYKEVYSLVKENQLTSTLSMILADKLYRSSLIACHFSLREKEAIESFVRHQLELSQFNPVLINETNRLELIQRILALYSIAEELPKDLDSSALKESIELIKQQKPMYPENMDQALFVFINAELHLMNEEKETSAKLEKGIIEAFQKAKNLPRLSPVQLEQFELLIWKIIDQEGNILAELSPKALHLLERELGNILIDNPKQSYRMIISATLQFFKKVLTTSFDEEELNEKAENWSAQNDMLIRYIHFDPKTPLLKILEEGWRESHLNERNVNHELFIASMKEKALVLYPLLSSFEEELESRLWILYKYLWYTTFINGNESTYERFILWHKVRLQRLHPDWSREKLQEALFKLSDQLLPLAPFQDINAV